MIIVIVIFFIMKDIGRCLVAGRSATSLPSVREQQEADSSVHQFAGRQRDGGSGDIRHDAVCSSSRSHLVRRPSLLHGQLAACRRNARHETLPPERQDNDSSTVRWSTGTSYRHTDSG